MVTREDLKSDVLFRFLAGPTGALPCLFVHGLVFLLLDTFEVRVKTEKEQ